MNEERVSFSSGDLTLEGLLAKPDGSDPVRGGVICHPHPLYGGSMYNNVVDAVLATRETAEAIAATPTPATRSLTPSPGGDARPTASPASTVATNEPR